MPTPLPSLEKAAFINLVKVAPYPGGPIEAGKLQSILNNYEDIETAIRRQLYLFAESNAYLVECISVFSNDAELVNVGIYFNKNSPNPLVNPRMLINSRCSGTVTIGMTSPPSSPPTVQDAFILLGSSYVHKLLMDEGMELTYLYFGPGSEMDIMDSSATDGLSSPPTSAFINNIYLDFARSLPSKLNGVVPNSQYGSISITPGSYFGGVLDYDPEATCNAPVTGLMAGDITNNSVTLLWNAPANGFLFINTYYRKSESAIWLLADQLAGDFIQNAGFIFRNLEKSTYYEFKVAVTCNNGGRANSYVNATTVCCPASNIIPATNCLINVLIKDAPDSSKTITLCNGVVIAQEYPSGATLQIPYLANKNITDVLIIDNAYYQGMPYTSATGTWDATGTSVGSFVDGNVVSIKAQLPV